MTRMEERAVWRVGISALEFTFSAPGLLSLFFPSFSLSNRAPPGMGAKASEWHGPGRIIEEPCYKFRAGKYLRDCSGARDLRGGIGIGIWRGRGRGRGASGNHNAEVCWMAR